MGIGRQLAVYSIVYQFANQYTFLTLLLSHETMAITCPNELLYPTPRMKHRLESKLPGEISITSDMQMTPPLWQKAKKN